jgi:mannitol/fructose-specific phosphotransferase system IIA component (Ntr-type)
VRAGGILQRADVLRRLAVVTGQGWPLSVVDGFVGALASREAMTSTAIGSGVAIPHARLTDLSIARIGLGLFPDGVVWPDTSPSHGEVPVRVVALLASREADHGEHLRLMAVLAMRLRTPGIVIELLAADDPIAVLCWS